MTPNRNVAKNHPMEQIIRSINKGFITRKKFNEELCLISQVEPKNVNEACKDNYWIKAMKKN